MMRDTRQETQSMLGSYPSINIVKTSKAKDIDRLGQNNNNNCDDKNPVRQYSSNSRGVFAQCLVTGAVLILTAGAGMPIGYSAVLLPRLAEDNGTLHADRELGSWIASVHSLATPFGSLLSGPLLDLIGRRGSLQLAVVPMYIGWIVIGCAVNIPQVLAGRLIAGFGVGLIVVPAQVIVGEMADPGLRGVLVGAPFAAYSMGILLVYALGAALDWKVVAFCGTVLPGLSLIALSFVPESPVWLARRWKIEAAEKALLWLRGGDVAQVNAEISLLETRAKADVARMSSTASLSRQATSAVSTILSPGVWKPLAIINVFNVLQILCGTYVIVFYGVDLISDIGGDTMDSYLAAVITAVVRFAFCLLACVLLLKMGRRLMGIISASGTALASLVLAGYTLARKEESSIDAYVLGTCLLVYVGANTVGLMCLPGLMMGELLPSRARGIGGGCTFFLFNLILFGVTKVFPMVNDAVGMSGVFTIFGASALLEAVFIYVAVPETKGRTLLQIEDYFQEGHGFWVTRRKEPKQNQISTLTEA